MTQEEKQKLIESIVWKNNACKAIFVFIAASYAYLLYALALTNVNPWKVMGVSVVLFVIGRIEHNMAKTIDAGLALLDAENKDQ